jgi:hypothetical protein
MKKTTASVLMVLSVIAIILAVYGAFANSDLWLASTQWLIIAGVLAIYALFYKE